VKTEKLSISVSGGRYQVSAISIVPDNPKAIMVLGHGAGAGMEHRFMVQLSENLASEGIGSLRFNFPYIEQGRRTPTSPVIAQDTIRAAVDMAFSSYPKLMLLAGGKSYGGRMTSQAQAQEALPGIRGLVFFGFPLHAPGKPGASRGAHLKEIKIPMLFLQGSRDKLADLTLLTPLVDSLENQATMAVLEGADHSFNMLKSAPKSGAEVLNELAKITAEWVDLL
jgi:predicted alpha/beta-hydrolase family hydrolase